MSEKYQFTSDWVTSKIPIWSVHLLPLAGRVLRCLEIGTHEGRSTVWFAESLLGNPSSRLMCVDPDQSEEALARWHHNVEATGRASQITLYRQRSQTLLPQLNQQFDLIYVDGDHHGAAVIADACNSWRLLNHDGILIFDDYQWTWPDYAAHELPGPAIDYFLSLYHQELVILEMGYQVIVRKIAKCVEPE